MALCVKLKFIVENLKFQQNSNRISQCSIILIGQISASTKHNKQAVIFDRYFGVCLALNVFQPLRFSAMAIQIKKELVVSIIK